MNKTKQDSKMQRVYCVSSDERQKNIPTSRNKKPKTQQKREPKTEMIHHVLNTHYTNKKVRLAAKITSRINTIQPTRTKHHKRNKTNTTKSENN